MEPSLDLTAILTLLGGAQGILLALPLLGLKQSNRTAIRLLAAFMIISSISIGGSPQSHSEASEHYAKVD